MTQGKPDLHEALDFIRDIPHGNNSLQLSLMGKNQWPSQYFRDEYLRYVRCMLTLGNDLMGGVARGLGLQPTFFEPYYNQSCWILRAIRYPIVNNSEMQIEKKSLGCGAHTDYGCLSIISADSFAGTEGCLQVQCSKTGVWYPVPPVEGGFVVNIGDMLAQWSGGQYQSTLHRVVSPSMSESQQPDEVSRGRISVAFFFEPNYDAVIKPIQNVDGAEQIHSSVVFGEHLLKKLRSNFKYIDSKPE